jgi:putative membrane protein
MVDDHTKANDELKQVASQENLTLPTTLDKKHQQMVDKLSALSGPAFDKAYVKDMVKDHEKDVKEFQKESQDGTDPNIKSFATKTLPVLQSHLESIKQISKEKSAT